MKQTLFIILSILYFIPLYCQNEVKAEINKISGISRNYTVNTPVNWVNDLDIAHQIGLKCFFYPKIQQENGIKSYMFVNEVEKDSVLYFDTFISQDLVRFREKNPEMIFKIDSDCINKEFVHCRHYKFSNLTDRYKEEVLYTENDYSYILFTFAASKESEFKKYAQMFNEFIHSFQYCKSEAIPKK